MSRYSAEGLEKIRQANETRFLLDAHAKFGGHFDYSRVSYQRQRSPVTIVCPKHGEFMQTPDKHLQSEHGCPKCGVAIRAASRAEAGQKQFRDLFQSKYGNRLELVSPYITSKSPIRCRCKFHNIEFDTIPDRLKTWKHGCPQCARESTTKSGLLTHESFLARAVAKFQNQFDLTQVKYSGMFQKVQIACPIHGGFSSTPVSFLNSTHGCPKCASLHVGWAENRIQRLEQQLVKPRPTTVALMEIEVFGISAYKLGITSRSLMLRYGENLKRILFEATLNEIDALKLEQHLHGKYFKHRDLRVFFAGMRARKRWAGDTETYKESCVNDILDDLRVSVAELERADPDYWEKQPNLVPPIFKLRSVRKAAGVFNQPKPVIRLDTGEVFPSATAAAAAVGTTQALVSSVCTGKSGHTKGIRFAYLADHEAGKVREFVSRQKGSNNPRAKAVKCIETNVVYPTISEAEKATGVHSGKIVSVCKGRRKHAWGFAWAYVEI